MNGRAAYSRKRWALASPYRWDSSSYVWSVY